jgi:subtilisin family serine protease
MIEKANFNTIENNSYIKNSLKLINPNQKYDILPFYDNKSYKDECSDFYYREVLMTSDINLMKKLISIESKEAALHENICSKDECSKLNPNLVAINLDKVREMGIDGKDVVVAVVDSGIIYNHPDIEKDRIIFYKDFSGESNENNPKDLLGHGTHVASLIGGSGKMSNGYNQGVAPGVKFVILRITSVSEIIKALEWIKENGKKYNIKVVNLSIGVDPKTGYLNDTIAKLANDLAQDYTVVAAAGNDYANETIDSPGIAPDVITVGGIDTKNTCDVSDDTIYDASSKGPTPFDLLDKPDVVAPAKLLAGARVPNSVFDPYKLKFDNYYASSTNIKNTIMDNELHEIYKDNVNSDSNSGGNSIDDIWQGKYYVNLSGTSGATAIVSGIAALIYQILPNATPKLIKEILMKTARKLKDPQTNQEYDKYNQGAGLVDAYNAIKYAMNLKNNINNTNLA